MGVDQIFTTAKFTILEYLEYLELGQFRNFCNVFYIPCALLARYMTQIQVQKDGRKISPGLGCLPSWSPANWEGLHEAARRCLPWSSSGPPPSTPGAQNCYSTKKIGKRFTCAPLSWMAAAFSASSPHPHQRWASLHRSLRLGALDLLETVPLSTCLLLIKWYEIYD